MRKPKTDKFGHCVICHKNLLVEQYVDNKFILRFTPDYDESMFFLNDASKMRVAICKPDKAKLTENDFDYIMECVFQGWLLELEENKTGHWSKEKKDRFIQVYKKKRIVAKADGVPIDVLKKKLNQYKEKFGSS